MNASASLTAQAMEDVDADTDLCVRWIIDHGIVMNAPGPEAFPDLSPGDSLAPRPMQRTWEPAVAWGWFRLSDLVRIQAHHLGEMENRIESVAGSVRFGAAR
jgi:hypothetical protein